MAGTVDIEQRDNVVVATLTNPPHGLMDGAMVAAIGALAARVDADPSIGAVVLTGGHDERFLAHYDVGQIMAVADAGQNALLGIQYFHDVMLSIQRCAAVWIAAINGHALGGGCELSLACDLRFMAEGDWRIGQPEILLGFPPGGGGTQRLARLLGTARAVRICLEGIPLTAARALEIGLVDRLIPRAELLDTAIAEATRLGRRPKAAIGACKRAVYEGGSLILPEGLGFEASEFVEALATPEARAAMTAYLDATERTGELPAYDFDQEAAVDMRGYYA